MEVLKPFFEALALLLAVFYDIYPSLGFAIIGLTLVVMIVLTPLTLKGTKSMMMMQQLQPEMKKLQSKYKDDRQQLNEEMMKFYKENNINPVGGCLPLLIQMPVFFFLYNVLKGISLRVPLVSAGWSSGQLGSGVSTTTTPKVFFDPAYVNHDSELYHTLHTSTTIPFLGMDLAESCSEALKRGFVYSIPYILLMVIVGISGFVQQRQIQGRTPNSQVSPQQQQIMKFMPIILPVISFGLPAGLVLYFAVSNLYRIGMQAFISRSIYGIKRGENPNKGDDGDKPAKNSPKPGSAGSKASSSQGSDAGPRGLGRFLGTKSEPDDSSGSNGSKGSSSSNGSKRVTPTKVANKTPAKSTAKTPKTPPKPISKTSTSKSTILKSDSSSSDKGTKQPSKAPAKKPAAAPSSATNTSPTLQPRARKNKKR